MEKTINILHLEDEIIDAELIQANLESAGIVCQITHAQGENEFISALRQSQYDLILADYNLPGYDGLTALRLVRDEFPDTPFIFVSGEMGEDAAIEALTQGATDYVLKHKLSRLVPAIRRVLRESEDRRELRRHEQQSRKLSSAVEHSPTSIVITGPDGMFEYVNSRFTEITGYTLEDAIKEDPKTLLFGLMPEEEQKRLWNLLKSGEEWRGEFRNRKKNGALYWESASISPILDGGDNITHFVAIKEDISERKQAENALSESEERYRTLFDNMLDGVYRSTPDGKFIDVNPAMVKMFGYDSKEELLAVDIKKDLYFSPGDRESVNADLEKIYDKFRMRRKDGSEIWLDTYGRYILDNKGNVIYVEGILHDITKRKQAEEALRESEERFRSVFESATIGLYRTALDGKILLANTTFARMLGCETTDELMQRDKEGDKIVSGYPRDEFLQILASQGEVKDFETQWVTENRKVLFVRENAKLINDKNGVPLYFEGTIEDITGRKLAEKKLAQQFNRMRILSVIDQAIITRMGLNDTLELIARDVVNQLQVDAAAILLLDTQTQTLNASARQGFHTDALKFTNLHIGDGLAGRTAQEREIVVVSNLSEMTENPVLSSAIKAEGFIFYVGVPLIANNQLCGVLEIFHRSHLDLNPDGVSFLNTLAGQAAISINSAMLIRNLQESSAQLELAYDTTLEGWSRALDLRDKETEGHTRRVTELTIQLAREIGLQEKDIVHIRRGGLLHDIGKMGIPDSILLKPGPLTDDEWVVMRKHPVYAFEMLSPIQYLQSALDIPHYHHEFWDGSGYPDGLKGEKIPLAARIFALADVWDALTSDRPYRAVWDRKKTLEYIRSLAGIQFDPQIVEVFLKFNSK